MAAGWCRTMVCNEKEYIIMDEKLVNILNEMAEYLSVPQMKKLQEVLLENLSNTNAQKENIENSEYLKLFLDAKRIEQQ